MANDDAEAELEFSPLSGTVTRDGVSVRVQIYRIAGSSEGWSLEVIDAEFHRTLEAEGIRSFAERPPGHPH